MRNYSTHWISSILLLCLFYNNIFGQIFNSSNQSNTNLSFSENATDKFYWDNQIYIVYQADVPIFWEPEKFNLSPTLFPELNKIKDQFEIDSIENSFYFSKNEFLKRTLIVKFSKEKAIDQLIESLKKESRFRLVEKIPIDKICINPSDTYYGWPGRLKVSPNPAKTTTNLEFEVFDSTDIEITIYDLAGKTVHQITIG